MKLKQNLFKTLLFVFILFVLSGCQPYAVTNVTIVGKHEVNIGKYIQLEVEVEPENARYKKIVWSSADPEIASISDAGKVEGIEEGITTISATISGVIAYHEIKVKPRLVGNVFMGINILGEEKQNTVLDIALVERAEGYIEENYNPYDYSEVNIYALLSSPTAKEYKVPAFWYRDYEFTFDTTYKGTSGVSGVASNNPNEPQGLEMVTWTDIKPHYRFRLKLDEVGDWSGMIYVEINGEIIQTIPLTLEIEASNKVNKGIVEVDNSNNRFFRFRDGETFIPVGINLGWWTSGARKTYDYLVWMKKLQENNMNMARIWLAPWGFALHNASYNNFYDTANSAARLDRVFEIAEENNIYIMLTLLNHGQFATQTNPTWNTNPYNNANGGIIAKPEYFFTSTKAKDAYKNELLYIIARYGYSDKIMAWELFNEVNWTDNFSINEYNVHIWHREMAQFVIENDYLNHMVTTSYNYEDGTAYQLNEIAFSNPHNYNYTNKSINSALPSVLERLFIKYGKPVLQSEVGVNWQDGHSTYRVDPTGITLRQGAWAGFMGGGAGGAMHWWWDSWVHPNNLYYQFKGAGIYASKLDLIGSDFDLLQASDANFSNNNLNQIGYRYPDRVYGYIFDKRWIHSNNKAATMINTTMNLKLSIGDYKIEYYNALTGALISEQNFTNNEAKYLLTLPEFKEDIAYIIIKR